MNGNPYSDSDIRFPARARWLQTASPVLWLLGLLIIAPALTAETENNEPAGRLELVARVDHLDTLAREPMVVRHPGGTLFLSGYGSQVTGLDWTVPPPLWRSDDNGESWSAVDVGTTEDGAQGNSDVDLAVGPDGTIYFLAMGFNRETRAGTHITIGVSHDTGATWNWHRLSTDRYDDRPWVSVAPDGTAHVIWNDGNGICHSISRDAGRSWAEQPRIQSMGGSSHLATGPDGEIAVRVSPISASANKFDEAADFTLTSLDGGKSWQPHDIPGNISWDATFRDPTKIPRWVEPLAWGPGRTLYNLWSEGDTVWLGWSADLGKTWARQIVSQEPGISFFPFMVANDSGTDSTELAATWFVQHEQSLSVRLVLINNSGGDSGSPEIFRAEPFTPSSWNEGGETQVPTPAGEYVPVVFLPDGQLGVVSPIQDSHNDRWGFTWWRFRLQREN
jgi:hypothetical protein